MFGRAPRFPAEKPSEVPGPNHYKLPEQENWDSYKRGAFLDRADRFGKDKAYEGPDGLPSTSEQALSTKDASTTNKRPEGPPSLAALRQQIESLKTQNAKLERIYELDSKRFQEQATNDKLRIESLVKQTALLEGQLTTTQKSHAGLKRDHDRALDRERVMKTKLERLESGVRDEGDRNAKYVALRKELDELRKLHEDEKRAHHAETQQLKTDLERNRKSSTDQQAVLKKLADAAEAKAQESKKSLLAAQTEITELRQKLRMQERERITVPELDQVKKALANAESSKRERDAKVAELEKLLRMEAKKKDTVEEHVKDLKEKCVAVTQELKNVQGLLNAAETDRDSLAKQLKEATSTISSLRDSLDEGASAAQVETDSLKILLQECTKLYGVMAASSVDRSQLEDEQTCRMEVQSRLIKLERRLQDKEAQVQELVVFLRYKAEQQDLLLRSLASAEEEIDFLQASRSPSKDSDDTAGATMLDSFRLEDDPAVKLALTQGKLALVASLEEYHREWIDILLKECKATDNVAVSLGAALNAVLERTAEIDGQLQVAQVEAEAARKRARETNEEVGVLKLEMDRIQSEHGTQIQQLTNENQSTMEEIVDVRRKFEDGKRRLEKAEMLLREKTTAEKALSDDVEGLSEALKDALRWEHAYKSLAEEVNALVQRNELVEREAEHLSRFNAEILGHTNPNQKIHYLDRIRRDLSDAKQKLAVSTRQRETVLEDNDKLRTELHAYRSLSESKAKSGPGMTRVTRMPLGMSSINGSSPSDSDWDSLPKVVEDQTLVLQRRSGDPMTLDELM